MDILIPIYPITEEKIILIDNSVKYFVEIWKSVETLQDVGTPEGKGEPEDVLCLDYVIYENLYKLFVNNVAEFVDLGFALLGKTLVNLLDFEWCEIRDSRSSNIALVNTYNDMRAPLRELIIHKLSTKPQYNSFEHLFFDILLSADWWQDGYHPLSQCNLEEWVDEFNYYETYGFEVPLDIRKDVELFIYQDEDLFIRRIGFDAYDLPKKGKWDELRNRLSEKNNLFNKVFGKDWKSRCQKSMNS